MASSKGGPQQAPSSTGPLPYLTLTPEDATNKPVATHVVGNLPQWLEGSLYRNGSGIFKVGNDELKHLFDGFSILHRFTISKGKVTYMSRVLDSESWEKSVKANRLVSTQFATYKTPDPCKTIFDKVMSFFKPADLGDPTDNTAVNIVEHGDRLYAMTETSIMVHVNPDQLNRKDKEKLHRETMAVHLSTAHPHWDSKGNMYNLATCFNPPHNYSIVLIPPPENAESRITEKAERLVSLESRWKMNISYNHSFGMSEKHFIIMEQPLVMSSVKFLTNNWRQAAPFQNFNRYPTEELVFRVVRRSDNKEVALKYRAAPGFLFHFCNCFETSVDDGSEFLVVDICGYDDLNIVEQLAMSNLLEQGVLKAPPTFRRFVLPLSVEQAKPDENLNIKMADTKATAVLRRDGSVFLTHDDIVEGGVLMELPRINYDQNNGKKYRYVYGSNLLSEKRRLVKLDVEKRDVKSWQEDGYEPGEPVFIQTPGTTAEDDGVILSPMIGLRPGLPCFLLVLDAASFQEIARAVTPDDVKMALSFHGTYVPKP